MKKNGSEPVRQVLQETAKRGSESGDGGSVEQTVFGDYSRYYDLLYADKDYEAETDYVVSLLERFGKPTRNVLEFGCGTGRHAVLLAGRGYHVTGVERSRAMAQTANARTAHHDAGGSFRCLLGDVCDLSLGKQFDAAIALFHVVSYQVDDRSVDAVFSSAARHVKEDGLFVFDVWHQPAVLGQSPSVRVKRAEDPEYAVTRIAEPTLISERHCVRVDYTLFVEHKRSARIERVSESHLMRYFTHRDIQRLAAGHGFKIELAEEWLTGRRPGVDTWGVCYVARKQDRGRGSGRSRQVSTSADPNAADFIPVNEPLLDGNESRYLQECIETGWISSEGPFVGRLEQAFATKVNRRHGIAVANGSGALDIAVKALQIGPGDEVIMPALTIISPAASVVRAGAVPVLVDHDPDTWNMDVTQIEDRITSHTKAILVVHIYGLPVDMDPVLKVAEKHGLAIIEDAAEMHGQTYRGRPCGSFGCMSTFSFYPNKHVTTGEGGMIVTDDQRLAERCRSLRNLCFEAERRFVHQELGWNYRMSNLQAAVGVAQLERLDQTVTRKRDIGRRYTELLRDVPGLQLPLAETRYAENIYWVFGVVLARDAAVGVDEIVGHLKTRRIGTRPFFWPMHEQPIFQQMGLFQGEVYPVAERLARYGFYLPSGVALSDGQIERVADAIAGVLNRN